MAFGDKESKEFEEEFRKGKKCQQGLLSPSLSAHDKGNKENKKGKKKAHAYSTRGNRGETARAESNRSLSQSSVNNSTVSNFSFLLS